VGDLTRWYRNGVTCVKGAFTDGHPEGVWELWHEGGQPGGKMVYSSGRLNGPVQLLWPDGATRCSAIFVDDLADGELTCAYEGGKPAVQALCKAGLFDGPYTAWHPDGAKLCELSFAAGLPCGSARWFGESGDLVASYDFKPDEGTWYYRDDRLWSYWYFGRSERSRVARAETVRVGLGASCSPFFLVDREESAADLPHGEFIGGLQSLSWTLASSVWAELPGGQPSLSTVRQNGRTEIRLEVAGGTPN
jgi:antitoxin component YwqK of YwqJK toxin-antitoxin module